MLLFVPPSTLSDIAHEHYRKVNSVPRQSTTHNPDHIFADESLSPDPVFMGLRALVSRGPIGALMRLIDRRIEAREEHLYGTPDTSPAVAGLVVLPHVERSERDIAA